MLLRLGLFAIFLGATLGQGIGQGIDTTAPAATPPAVVKGSVLSTSGAPVRYASLRLVWQDSSPGTAQIRYTTEADDQGKFVFDEVPAGHYTLTASRPGYLYRVFGSKKITSPVGEILQADAGKTLGNLIVVMAPQGMIGGKITDESGEPVEGASVRAFSRQFLRGRRIMSSAGYGQSAADGSYVIGGLYPGRYYIAAFPPSGQYSPNDRPGTRQRFARIRPTFYGNASDSSLAVPIQLEAGAEFRGASIDMVRAAGYEVSGRLSEVAPRASTISLVPTDLLRRSNAVDEFRASVAAGSDAFVFKDVPPGDYELLVRPNSQPGPQAAAPLPVAGALLIQVRNADITGLNVLPVHETALAGTISLEGGDLSALAPEFALINESGTIEPAFKVDSQGTFYDAHVRVGTYQVSLPFLANGSYYLKSALLNGVALERDVITLPDASQSRLQFVLSPRAASVSGIVRDGSRQPVSSAHIVTWPVAVTQRDTFHILPIPEQFSEKNGEYESGNLPPGEFYVAAFEDTNFLLFQSYQFLSQFEARAAKIKVEEGAHASAELSLIDSAAIEAAEALLP